MISFSRVNNIIFSLLLNMKEMSEYLKKCAYERREMGE